MAGSAAGVYLWQRRASRAPDSFDARGFDLAEPPVAAPSYAPSAAPAAPAARPSSLGMARLDAGTVLAGAGAAPGAKAGAGSSSAELKEAARTGGRRLSAFTEAFRRKHPVLLEYRRAWLSRPDLKALNDEYLRDRDPARFARGLASAPSFAPLVRKIAADPRARGLALEFAAGAVKETPPELMAAAASALKDEGAVLSLVKSVASALGVPASMLPGLDGASTIDEKAVLERARAAAPPPR